MKIVLWLFFQIIMELSQIKSLTHTFFILFSFIWSNKMNFSSLGQVDQCTREMRLDHLLHLHYQFIEMVFDRMHSFFLHLNSKFDWIVDIDNRCTLDQPSIDVRNAYWISTNEQQKKNNETRASRLHWPIVE